jgi:hypothetical protein
MNNAIAIDPQQMEIWISRSEAIADKIERIRDLSAELEPKIEESYQGQASGLGFSFARNLYFHMEALLDFHEKRTLHMKDTLETMKQDDEFRATQLAANDFRILIPSSR